MTRAWYVIVRQDGSLFTKQEYTDANIRRYCWNVNEFQATEDRISEAYRNLDGRLVRVYPAPERTTL